MSLHQDNLAYFESMSTEDLIHRRQEAREIWFRLLMSEPHEDFVEEHLATTEFWDYNLTTIETVLRERNVDLEQK